MAHDYAKRVSRCKEPSTKSPSGVSKEFRFVLELIVVLVLVLESRGWGGRSIGVTVERRLPRRHPLPRTSQPIISRPIAAIQLPATRTAMRAQ